MDKFLTDTLNKIYAKLHSNNQNGCFLWLEGELTITIERHPKIVLQIPGQD